MTTAQISDHSRWHRRSDRGDRGLVRDVLALIAIWRRRAHERQMLMTMDDMMLRDIGITRCDAMNEAEKPFWRA